MKVKVNYLGSRVSELLSNNVIKTQVNTRLL